MRRSVWSRVLGAIGALWGALVVFAGRPISSDGAFAAGQKLGVAMGAVTIVVGLYYLFRPNRPKA